MKYVKTFERFNTPQSALQYKKGENIVFIKDYDDKLKRGTTYKVINVEDNMITIEDIESHIRADVEFDGDVENYFKKCNTYNNDIDSDLLN